MNKLSLVKIKSDFSEFINQFETQDFDLIMQFLMLVCEEYSRDSLGLISKLFFENNQDFWILFNL